jgi:hypothetical protein
MVAHRLLIDIKHGLLLSDQSEEERDQAPGTIRLEFSHGCSNAVRDISIEHGTDIESPRCDRFVSWKEVWYDNMSADTLGLNNATDELLNLSETEVEVQILIGKKHVAAL